VAPGVFGAMLASALPAAAVPVNGSVIVKWNTNAIASLALATDYDATGAQQKSAPLMGTVADNGGSGTFGAPAAEVAATVNFGNITPDVAQATGCLYNNAVNALVKTNSTSWTLTEALAANVPAGYVLCALANNAGGTFAGFNSGANSAAQSGRAAAVAGTTCPAGSLTETTALSTAVTSTTAYPSGANIGQDMELITPANAASGATTLTLNYQVIAN